jgi:hypothetical protein
MASETASSGPLLQLLASGLQLWVRQQCQSIDSLDIALQGSALGLLRGRLAGVQLLARRAVFAHLPIEQVELTSEPITVHMGNLLQGQPVKLDQAFTIEGQISLSTAGLTTLFSDPRWRELAELLHEQVLGQLPLQQVRIEPERLVFVLQGNAPADRVELQVMLRAAGGTIELTSPAGELLCRLPMDPNIAISRAWIEAGMVQLQGRARVSP